MKRNKKANGVQFFAGPQKLIYTCIFVNVVSMCVFTSSFCD